MIYQYEEGMEPALARLPIPLLNISAHALPARLPSLHADSRAIGRVAAEHLLARGHDRLAAMVDPAHAGAGQRGEAFLETVRAAGARGEWVEITPGREDFADWLAAHPGRWGVFAFTDEVGRALLEAAREVGRPVPESLAVVGVDNDPLLCGVGQVGLSSVMVPLERIGEEAARQLDTWMEAGLPASALPVMERVIEPLGVLVRRSSDTWVTGDPLVDAALRFIRDHAGEFFGVPELAEALGVGRRRLERSFRRWRGRPVGEAITAARLERAKERLAGTDEPVYRIARACGYRSSSYFGKVFRRHTGLAPAAFRRRVATGFKD